MTEKAPPFVALRALEAAARHKSFTWAAKELNITHSAVSQSIRRLEAELGATLFERRGGAMQPSDAALKLAQVYADTAQVLGEAIRDISGTTPAPSLSLSLPASFARLWFAPKLGRLAEAVPDVRVNVTSPAGARGVEVEVAIASASEAAGLVLAPVTAHPVCRADLARGGAVRTPAGVLAQNLVAGDPQAWQDWAAQQGARRTPTPHVFEDVAAALESAAEGGGVALANQFEIEPFVLSGRLVPLPFATPTAGALTFRSSVGGAKADLVERLLMWLKLEVARSAALLRSAARAGTM